MAVLLALLGGGCGLAKYEQRLAQTAEYFEYHNNLNQHLQSPAWTASVYWEGQSVPVGLSMRIPKDFVKLAAPQPLFDENQNFVGYTEETRQPYLLTVPLEGIVDAWEIQKESGLVRLYVLGNYDKLLLQAADAGAVDPTLYFDDLELRLQQGFQVSFVDDGGGSPTEDNRQYSESFPSGTSQRFQIVKNFNVFNIAPLQPIEGVEWRAQLYEVYEEDTGPVRAAILCIFPAEERGSIVEPLELALETLSVSNQAPNRPDETGTDGGTF
jgi:hypothetical protein